MTAALPAGATRIVLALCTVALACAACTSTETRPSQVTWGDLVEGNRLDAYLKSREADLKSLESQSAGLSAQLSKNEASLAAVEAALAAAEKTASQSDAELAAIRRNLESAEEELAEVRGRATDVQARIAGLRAGLQHVNDKATAQEQIARSEVQLERLQSEVAALEKQIQGTLLVRARDVLDR